VVVFFNSTVGPVSGSTTGYTGIDTHYYNVFIFQYYGQSILNMDMDNHIFLLWLSKDKCINQQFVEHSKECPDKCHKYNYKNRTFPNIALGLFG
jgi:hypothetical protein